MNTHFLRLLIVISLVSFSNSCSCNNKLSEPTKEETKKIEFKMDIFHQYRPTDPPLHQERKEVFISIENPTIENNAITKRFDIEFKLHDLPSQKLSLENAAVATINGSRVVGYGGKKIIYPGTNIEVYVDYNDLNQSRINFHGSNLAEIDEKFKAGNTIEVTISGQGYEKCTKTMTIPAKVTWP